MTKALLVFFGAGFFLLLGFVLGGQGDEEQNHQWTLPNWEAGSGPSQPETDVPKKEAFDRRLNRLSPQRKKLKEVAQVLTWEDLLKLKNVVLNPSEKLDKRIMSIYLMSHAPEERVVGELAELASRPISPKSKDYEDELLLRVQALRAFKRWTAGAEDRGKRVELYKKLQDKTLRAEMVSKSSL